MVAGERLQAESFQQNLRNKPVGHEGHFFKHFSLFISSNFRYQPFGAVSGNLGGKGSIIYDFLTSHEHEVFPTTSLNENCIEFELQTDRNYYVDLRQTYLASTLKISKGRACKTYNTEEV